MDEFMKDKYETANKVKGAIYRLNGLCLDGNTYEYYTAIIAVCEAIGASYPREWVIDCCGDGGDESRFDLTEKDKELLSAYHEARRNSCPVANDYGASWWAFHERPDFFRRCIGEDVTVTKGA